MRDINAMTRRQLCRAPYLEWNKEILCDSLIILPAKFHWPNFLLWHIKHIVSRLFHLEEPEIYQMKHLHDSGFRIMEFVAIIRGEPAWRISGCSDVIHIQGIGGFGYRWAEKYNHVPTLVPPTEWNIDCLARSGLLRLYCRGNIRCGHALSSFAIYQEKDESN